VPDLSLDADDAAELAEILQFLCDTPTSVVDRREIEELFARRWADSVAITKATRAWRTCPLHRYGTASSSQAEAGSLPRDEYLWTGYDPPVSGYSAGRLAR
jgi:hypothetical protein